MGLFHKHKWVKVKETRTEPLRTTFDLMGSSYDFQKLTLGVTTILWECGKCHKIRKEEMLGK